MKEKTNGQRVSRKLLCPVCEHDSHCIIFADAVLCMRVKSDRPYEFRDGKIGWIHRNGTAMQQHPTFMPPKKPRLSDAVMHNRWAPKARAWFMGDVAWNRVREVAYGLGVYEGALGDLGVGWDGTATTWPEKNGAGLIVGVKRRLLDGTKVYHLGSRAGLTYSDTFADNPGPIFVVEGGSDVAAGITMGLACVGRPSNTGGVPYLVRLLGPLKDRKIIVVAERDGKEGQVQEEWPGVFGAKSCRDRLRQRLGRVVRWAFMPDSAKDMRAWLVERKVDVTNQAACFKLGKSLARRI